MLWESYQQSQNQDTSGQAHRALSKAERYADDIADAKNQIERLSLACQAMWELLRDRSNMSEADLEAKILEIDARDGVVDGKIRTQSLTCHACNRPTTPIFPPSGPIHWLFQGPPAESKILAAIFIIPESSFRLSHMWDA